MVVTMRMLQQRRMLAQQPSGFTGQTQTWAQAVADVLNQLPPYSVFSYGNPNSNVSAIPGTVGFNISSVNTNKLWSKQVGSGNTGWVPVVSGSSYAQLIEGALTISGRVTVSDAVDFNDSGTRRYGIEGGSSADVLDFYSHTGPTVRIQMTIDALRPAASGGMTLGTAALPWGAAWLNGLLTASAGAVFGAPARLRGYPVAQLPAGTQGDTSFVTDALAPAFLTAVVGGGAVVTPVFYDGTNWVAM